MDIIIFKESLYEMSSAMPDDSMNPIINITDAIKTKRVIFLVDMCIISQVGDDPGKNANYYLSKYRIVLNNPSSRHTFGSHLSSFFAFVTSGLRTLGSSTGRPL